MKSDKCPSQKGAGVFIVCIPLSPIGQKRFGKNYQYLHEIFAERLLRGIKSQYVTFLIFIFKTIHRLRFWKIKIRYVFHTVYLRNGFDKLFGYQYHLSGDIAGTALNASYACIIFCLTAYLAIIGVDSPQYEK